MENHKVRKFFINLNFILITISLYVFSSCTSIKSQNNIDVLFKRWKIDYIEMDGQKVDEIAGEKIVEEGEFEYEFRKDCCRLPIFSTPQK